MRSPPAGPRLLLRRLREAMAEPIDAQQRLDKIVVLIAANMVAEVCSVYLLRADGVLELFATEGLNRSAVHQTLLKVGEGLVGLIAATAQPLNISDAQSHPSFAYRPETGEEIYRSFLGVPILRAGRILGVLVVQNTAHRTYSDEEIEALQTTSMVIAEMVAVGEFELAAKQGPALDLRRPMHLEGLSLSDGVGVGQVVLHEPRVVVTNLIAEDGEYELARLDRALGKLRLSLDAMLERRDVARDGEPRDVLEAYAMFARDRGWARKMEEAIRNGLTAEAAAEKVQSDTRAQMLRSTDPYLRERLHDLDDLANRLLRELMGRTAEHNASLPANAVLVARNMGAAELLDYDRDRLRGLVLEEGGPTSHISIVAKALGIPTVGQVATVVSLAEAGDTIIVDGEMGSVHLRPPQDVENAFAERVRFRARRQAGYRRLRNRPAVTKDGHAINLHLNAGLLVDMQHVEETGAAAIGLFRTELLFMVSQRLPRVSEQEAIYRQVIEAAGDRPINFRSLDIGGDKLLPYLRSEEEENPALGWRAIRLGLDRPALMRTQIRALLMAAAGRELRLMFPMVTTVKEYRTARAMVDRELRHLRRHGHPLAETIRYGVMIEVPSLLFELDELLEEVDFISVGSNDLFQFMTAADRGNTRVSGRYDPISVPFLRVLRLIVEKATALHVPVSLCGEMAGNPLSAMVLIALGYRTISMPPASIGPVKDMVLSLDIGRLRARLLPRLEPGCWNGDLRAVLKAYAEENEIPIG